MPQTTRYPEKTVQGLTLPQWLQLEKFIFEHLNTPQGKPTTRINCAGFMFAFGRNFDLPAMYRFLVWALEQGEEPAFIMATIAHDLNGRNQDPATFSPRTSSY